MAGVVLVFDFDKTIIECDSDYWVMEEFGVSELFNQLRPTLPWNTLMDRMVMEVQSRGNTIEDIADCLRRVSLHPKLVSVIKSAHASGCDLRIISDANVFFIKTILKKSTRTRVMLMEKARLRVSPYHDFHSSFHGCNICPPNMCKGLIMERIQASVSSTGNKRFIYLGDGGLKLEEDFLMPRKNFPVWKLICSNPKLIRANIHEWKDGEELCTVLSNLINKIFMEKNCAEGVNQIVPGDCKFQTSSVYLHEAIRNALPVTTTFYYSFQS